MSSNQWVYEKATGKWLLQFRDPSVYLTNKTAYGLADLGDGPIPDPIHERATADGRSRKATADEIAESQADRATLLKAEPLGASPLEVIVKQLVADVAALKAGKG